MFRVAKGAPEVLAAAYKYFVQNQVILEENGPIYLGIQCEPAPDPESRVFLSEEKDALGSPKVKIDWKLGDLDARTIEVFVKMVDKEFRRLGLAEVDLDSLARTPGGRFPLDVFDSNHHMGTTRMSADPTRGVVDTECRVHGVDNLYIGSTSVLPPPASRIRPSTLWRFVCALQIASKTC